MFEDELIKVGKQSKIILDNQTINNTIELNQISGGKLYFKPLSRFDSLVLSNNDLFLIIDNKKVRYILPEILELTNSHIVLKLGDFSIIKELLKAQSVYLALDKNTCFDSISPKNPLIGMKVYFRNNFMATVIDVFNNMAHDVIVVKTQTGKEVLLPDIEQYVIEKDFDNNRIMFDNIQDFLDL